MISQTCRFMVSISQASNCRLLPDVKTNIGKPATKTLSKKQWIEGDALDLPFSDSYFDAITIGYGLRNLIDRHKAMREIFRVLKPGFLILSYFC
ncbi:hypothetical protein BHE74_00019170 [Ensete ventricosum]|nr:hypothetical protein GW17_00029034 [Ensete ventricosum]RWW72982.1 hypothetical protein BHE74_00019170 [Ensete ventricosum]RZR86420.1 hypothetical protein BHM03_00013619 [Ensete ventricosum]